MNNSPRFSLLTSAALLTGTLTAQFDVEWKQCIGGSAFEDPRAILAVPSGGYMMVGNTDGTNPHTPTGYHGGGDIWAVRLDAEGAILWQRYIGGNNFDAAEDVCQVSDGGFILVGSTQSMSGGDFNGCHGGYTDGVVMKLDSEGNTVWQRCMGGSGDDELNAIAATPDGGAILTGASTSSNGDLTSNQGTYDLWVVKLAADGTTEWSVSYGGSQGEMGYGIKPTPEGGYIVAGQAYSSNGDVVGHIALYDAWVLKLSSTGALEWQLVAGGNHMDDAQDIALTADGGYIIAGSVASSTVEGYQGGGGDLWVVKISATGTQEWQRCLGGTEYDGGGHVVQMASGHYLVVGSTDSNNGDVTGNHGGGDLWAVELDADGEILNQQCFGGNDWEMGFDVANTPDGGAVLLGIVNSNNGDADCHSGAGDAWVIKLAGDGTTGVVEQRTRTFTASPNPTRDVLTLRFVEHTRPTHLRVIEASGRVVLQQGAAAHSGAVTLHIGALQAGAYLVEVLYADSARAMQRIVKN